MACNDCETGFQGTQSVVVSVEKDGTNALLYVQNQGLNIVQLSKILLCRTPGPNGLPFQTLELRAPP